MTGDVAGPSGMVRMAVVGCDYVTNLGLTELLSHDDCIEVVGTVPNAREVLALMAAKPFDLVLVDAAIKSADLMETCRTLNSTTASPRVVVMGDVPVEMAESLLFAGVSAILHHGSIAEHLPVALWPCGPAPDPSWRSPRGERFRQGSPHGA